VQLNHSLIGINLPSSVGWAFRNLEIMDVFAVNAVLGKGNGLKATNYRILKHFRSYSSKNLPKRM
jgi:hypothetical protein